MKDCNDFLIVRLSERPELCEAAVPGRMYVHRQK